MEENPCPLLKLESLSSSLSLPKLLLSLSDVNVIIIPLLKKQYISLRALFLILILLFFRLLLVYLQFWWTWQLRLPNTCFRRGSRVGVWRKPWWQVDFLFLGLFWLEFYEFEYLCGTGILFIIYFWITCLFTGFCVVPDLETVKFKVLSRRYQYEIREVEVLFVFLLELVVVIAMQNFDKPIIFFPSW